MLRKKGVADFLISEDFKSVKLSLVTDVLVPNVKKLIQELVTNGINQILYDNGGTSSNNSSVRSSHISYRSFSDKSDHSVDNKCMVIVADLYDLACIQSEYTDQKYGWTDVRSAKIVNIRDGFLLKMPRVRPL